MNRRDLLLAGVAVPVALAARRSFAATLRKLNILILGGTNFLGPAIVESAILRGHAVTLFNRGKTNPGLFPKLELLRGDREAPDGLTALHGRRRWDVVIDVWPDNATIVGPTAQLLRDRTSYYFFVSSVAAYADFTTTGMDETAPLKTAGTGYGARKAGAEQLLASIFSNRCGVARPGVIAGPRDSSLSNHYWLSRLSHPGSHIGPGDGLDPFQLIDVRDVADWIIHCAETSRAGAYNVCAPAMTWKDYLAESQRGVRGSGYPVWIPADFLKGHGVNIEDGSDMPAWRPRGGQNPGFSQISSARAQALGLRTRPFHETQRDAWASYQTLFPTGVEYPFTQYGHTWGISEPTEQEILAAWSGHQA